MRQQRLFIAAIVGAIAVSVAPRMPVNATPTSEVSCSNAKSELNEAHSMLPTAPATTSDVDKDFAATEYRVAQAQVIIGHVVAKCSKVKENRQAAYEMERDAERRLQLFRDQGAGY